MKISAAFKDAFRVYSRFGATVKFLVVEACMTLAAFVPLLFLAEEKLKFLALLAVPAYILLVFWARVNAAAAMRDALGEGSLFSWRLIEPAGYGRKLLYGLKQMLKLLVWSIPLIACLIIAKENISGETDGFTVLRMIKSFGGGDLMTGVWYLALIFMGTLILTAFGCAFHSGDRHAFVRENPKLLRGRHGKVLVCWVCSLAAVLPMIVAVVILVIRYLPALQDLNGVLMKTLPLPSTKVSAIIAGVGAVLTLPLLPLRSLTVAAFVEGLEKE